ncbi:MAG: QueT transporter family protein [Actinobacteria bacterium]|nr:MAG: QueT transporter family protein [Actinomycetota bacterium]
MKHSRRIAQAGIIAAVYAVLTFVMIQTGLASGPVQFRLSEALTVVACLTPAAIPGLALGSVVANAAMLPVFGPIALLDVVFGSLGTLLGAMWMWRFRRRRSIALLGPVVTNALIVPAYLPIILAAGGYYEHTIFGVNIAASWPAMYAFGVVTVGIGQFVSVYILGGLVLVALRRLGFERLFGMEID